MSEVMVIVTGGAATGKTYLLKKIEKVLKDEGLKTSLDFGLNVEYLRARRATKEI